MRDKGDAEVAKDMDRQLISLDISRPIWESFFTVAPLVVVGSREEDGSWDFAPKHMASPLGWDNFFGFVCTPRHGTYHNVQREKVFTVTYPRPSQVLLASLAASGRAEDGTKPGLQALPTAPCTRVDGVFLKDGYLFLECELERVVDGFGSNSLIAGRVVAAQVHEQALRSSDADDSDVVRQAGMMAYLYPGRFVPIEESLSFPFSADFRR